MLRSLLVSRDEKTVHTVGRVFKDLEVQFEHCSESGIALEQLAKYRYDAVVLDDQIEDAAGILEKVLALSTCNKAVRIILAEPVAAMHADPALSGIPTIGYVSHVDTDTINAARQAGMTEVLPRSAFTAQLADILKRT